MKLIIDIFSRGWVHSDFNVGFINSQSTSNDLIIGIEGSEFINKLRHSRNVMEIKNKNYFLSILKEILFGKEVIFLVMLNKHIPLVLISSLLGKKVSYVVHKYNLSTRKKSFFINFLYDVLAFLRIKSITLEEPNLLFKNNIIVSIDMWKNVKIIPPKKINSIKNIAFIGKPVVGKNFELLKFIADKHNIKIIVYSDENLKLEGVSLMPFNSDLLKCDLIWGYYDENYYKGIQSGLCYPCLESGLKVITNRNIGFKYFSERYSDYLIVCGSQNDLITMLKK